MSGHTPGGWKVGPTAGMPNEKAPNWLEIPIYQDGSFPFQIARCFGTVSPMVDHLAGACHVHANARLVAAAPDLLEVVREALDKEWNPFEPDNQSATWKRWKAALNKAQRETK